MYKLIVTLYLGEMSTVRITGSEGDLKNILKELIDKLNSDEPEKVIHIEPANLIFRASDFVSAQISLL